MKKKIFTLLLPLLSGYGAATDLLISEYCEGSSLNKYIEIFNGTADPIDLGDYALWKISNGGDWAEYTRTLSGTLASGQVFVVYHPDSDTAIITQGDFTTSFANWNGNDAVGLARNVDGVWTLIDVVGTDGADPGTGWAVAGTADATVNHTLVRKASINVGNTNWTTSAGSTTEDSEWTVYAQDYFDDLGSHQVDYSLPVELSVFKSVYSQGFVKLMWITDSEIENQGFILERRSESKDWAQIASFDRNPELLGQGSTTSKTTYIYPDQAVKVGHTYEYRLSDVDYQGNITTHGPIQVTVHAKDGDSKPGKIKLNRAYPNPFNPDVNISFTLDDDPAELVLEIFDLQGDQVMRLGAGHFASGTHIITWDGRDMNGNDVASGVYLARLMNRGESQIQRITLLR